MCRHRTATGVGVVLTDTDQSILNPRGVDAIRSFPSLGFVVWGARTLATNTEWPYVTVRRMKLYLEESIKEGTAWAIFEPNDAALWSTPETDVDDFLYARYLDGWFQGTKPSDACFARCDASTMTQTDIQDGRTLISVGFAPLRPAEFVVFTVVQARGLFVDGSEWGGLGGWSSAVQ